MESRRAPTVQQLRAFVAVAGTCHFGEAAAQLGVTQPSVSAAIAGLESTLGVFLVERSTRRVVLTPAGTEVVTHARRVLDALDRLVDVAARGGQPFAGPLRIGVIPTVAPYVLPFVFRTLSRHFPLLRPDVKEDQTARLLDDLAHGQLDVVLLALPSGGEDVVEVPLYDEEFVLLLPDTDPLAGSSDLDAAVLQRRRLLLLEEGHCLRDQVLDVCRQAGASTTHPARATSLTTLSRLVAAGLGDTLLPATAISVEARRGLATASFRSPAPGRRIGLVHRASSDRGAEFGELAARLAASLRATRLPVRPVVAAAEHEEATGRRAS